MAAFTRKMWEPSAGMILDYPVGVINMGVFTL